MAPKNSCLQELDSRVYVTGKIERRTPPEPAESFGNQTAESQVVFEMGNNVTSK